MNYKNKIQKANELRKISKKSFKDLESISNKWISSLNKAKSMEEKRKIDKIFEPKLDLAEQKDVKAYNKYHDYVLNNFNHNVIQRCCAGGVFQEKEFISRLQKECENTNKRRKRC